jgi:hypothetical protein
LPYAGVLAVAAGIAAVGGSASLETGWGPPERPSSIALKLLVEREWPIGGSVECIEYAVELK